MGCLSVILSGPQASKAGPLKACAKGRTTFSCLFWALWKIFAEQHLLQCMKVFFKKGGGGRQPSRLYLARDTIIDVFLGAHLALDIHHFKFHKVHIGKSESEQK